MLTANLSILILLFAMTSIQVGSAVAKQLIVQIGPAATTLLRCGLAAVFLVALWRPWRGALPRRTARLVAIYGAALGLMNLTFYMALKRIPLGLTVAIEFTGPLTVALLGSRRVLDFVWAGLAAAGLALLLPITSSSAPLNPVGIFFALVAGGCWALYIVFGNRAGRAVHGGRATALGMSVAAVAVLPFGVATAGPALVQPRVWPLALFVAVFSSALPYSLEMIALKRLPTKTFGILMSLEPALAALSGLIILGEHLSSRQLAAIACVMAASTGSAFSRSV